MKVIYLRIAASRIGWFKFILEGYDGLAVLTTVDRGKGIVSVRFHSSVAHDFFHLLAAICKTLRPEICPEKAIRPKF